MKRHLVVAISLIFISIGVFGIYAMGHSYGGLECLASLATGVTCPDNPLEIAAFHLNLFQSFSLSFAVAAIFSFILAFLALFITLVHPILEQKNLFVNLRWVAGISYSRKFLSWYSLLENSPTRLLF